MRARPGHGTNQGLRNHTSLTVRRGSGLRVSEALGLDREPYTGKGFTRVQVKGGLVRDFVPLHRESHKVLDDWLEARKDEATPIFITRTGRRMPRREAAASMATLPPKQTGGYRTTIK